MAAQGRRGREDYVVSDDAIVADMAVIHVVTARTDARETAALLGPDVHRDAFADGASFTDFEPGRLPAVAEVLWGTAQRGKRVDHAAVGDGRMSGQRHMRDQLAIGADH